MQSTAAPGHGLRVRAPERVRGARPGLVCLLAAAALLAAPEATAQQRSQRLSFSQQEALRDRLNESTLVIATSRPTASYFAMAEDIAAVIGASGDLRLLPIPSDAGIGALRDLLYLRGVDMGIVPANVLAKATATEMLGAGLPDRIAYITRLYSEEVHLLVGRDTGALEDLRGKRVAVPPGDGTALFTAEDLFPRVRASVEIVRTPAAEALDQVRAGKLAGVMLVAAKPSPHLTRLPKDGSIRLLALPFSADMEEGYAPAAFRADDYPTLIPDGRVVESVAVAGVLMAHSARGNAQSAQRTAEFVPAFFSAVSERSLLGRSSKWREVNLAATLPGWSRMPAAEEWLREAQRQQAQALQRSFEEFLRETRPPGSPSLTAAQRNKLFDAFVEWTRKSVSETDALARR
jgi:TRAP-type uncharacterized transport system substrate-binding protein